MPERHDVPMAPLDSFVQLGLDEAGEVILLDYTFALCIPGSWPFPSSMDKTILPESYFSEGNPVEEDANTVTVAKKTRKHKGRKTQNRSKSAGATSSASEASPAWAKTATQTDEECAKQVIQDLHLSSDGSDSEVPNDTGNPPKGGDSENSGPDPQGPPTVPDQEPSTLPGIPSGDQLPDNGQDNPVPPQPDANTPDPDASASDPLPKLVHPPGLPSLTPLDSSHCSHTRASPRCTSWSRSGNRVSSCSSRRPVYDPTDTYCSSCREQPSRLLIYQCHRGAERGLQLDDNRISVCMSGRRGNSAEDVGGSHTAKP